MLKRFEVKGFKNFENSFVLDFSDVRDYRFNEACIRNNLLNNIIIYGKNGVGKSNLGIALFDITTHLTDKNVSNGLYDYYLNVDSSASYAEFIYAFQFETIEIIYSYRKTEVRKLIYEKLEVQGNTIFEFDYVSNSFINKTLKEIAPHLNYEFKDSNISILKYIVNNSNVSDAALLPLSQMVRFVNNMLWFRNLDENRYIGYKTDSSDYFNFIFERDNVNKLQILLGKAGIKETLLVKKEADGKQRLYFKKYRPIPFFNTASNGTKSLYALFYWLTTAQELSFLFIDEFDAFYHTELSQAIVELLQEYPNFQTILTSHNTNLLSNKIMRPDCYFILTNERLTSLCNATDRELREGHNLEKLYLNGEFNE